MNYEIRCNRVKMYERLKNATSSSSSSSHIDDSLIALKVKDDTIIRERQHRREVEIQQRAEWLGRMLLNAKHPNSIVEVSRKLGYDPPPTVGDLMVVNPVLAGEDPRKQSVLYTRYYPQGDIVETIAVGTILGPIKEIRVVNFNGVPALMGRVLSLIHI